MSRGPGAPNQPVMLSSSSFSFFLASFLSSSRSGATTRFASYRSPPIPCTISSRELCSSRDQRTQNMLPIRQQHLAISKQRATLLSGSQANPYELPIFIKSRIRRDLRRPPILITSTARHFSCIESLVSLVSLVLSNCAFFILTAFNR